MIRMITIKDVAEKANVSVATVSRTLNNDSGVSEQTRKKVMSAVDTLGYTTNVLGRNLRMSRTNKILILLPDMSNIFYSDLILGINSVASENNYLTMISSTTGSYDDEIKYMQQVFNKSFDGVILASSSQSADELTENAKKVPIVMCCEYVDGADVSVYQINNRKAEFEMTEHLIKNGHSRIALITSDCSFSGRERTEGYFDALKKYGISIRNDYVIYGGYEFDEGYHSAERLLQLNEPPTAVIAISDRLAHAVKAYAVDAGLDSGLAICGFDDTYNRTKIGKKIYSVSQPTFEIGRLSMLKLLEKIKDNSTHNDINLLDYKLIID